MFVDTAKVSLKAGDGGRGAVSFRHEIYIPKGGPDGGDGGKGGDIVFRADRNTNTLVDFRFTPILTAEDGKAGSGQRSSGRSGRDLVVDVPVGTVVYRLMDVQEGVAGNAFFKDNFRLGSPEAYIPDDPDRFARQGGSAGGPAYDAEWATSVGPEKGMSDRTPSRILLADLTYDGQTAIIAKGGEGGFGNAHFKSSTRQTPMIAEVGEPGEAFEAEVELKSMADVGLVGLPNAGKSTFLSVVSNATPEIADYPFTTLTPQLGVATIDGRDLLIADIPGLIEGAADGKGLGHDFLRHVERTAVLLHLVDIYNNDAGEAYQTIRHELERYSDLKNRPEIVALTKCEGVDREIIEMQMASILAQNPNVRVYAISSSAHQGLTDLLRALKSEVERAKAVETTGVGVAGNAFFKDDFRLGSPEAYIPDDPDRFARQGGSAGGPAYDAEWATSVGPEKGMPDRTPTSIASLPTISLPSSALNNTWSVTREDDKFIVTGDKIEKFARKTDLDNYASLNRLRDIMKKLGIRAELTSLGATPESIISIAGKEFTLVEDY